MKETEALLHFVAEREHVRLKKEAGQPWPWTNDPILRDYKFCCVRREDDRVTKGIATLYREPFENDPELWFALLVARRAVNWPDTLAELGYPVPWNPEHFRAVIRSRQAAGHKAYEAQAYKVMVSGQAGEQADLIVSHVLTPIDLCQELKLIEFVGFHPIHPGSVKATNTYRILIQPLGGTVRDLPTVEDSTVGKKPTVGKSPGNHIQNGGGVDGRGGGKGSNAVEEPHTYPIGGVG